MAIVAFITIPKSGAKEVLRFSESVAKHMNWMGWWSMWAFVAHKAIFYLVAPYFIAGLGLMIAAMPIFYCAWRPKLLHHGESPREDGIDTPSGTGLKRSSQNQEDFDPN